MVILEDTITFNIGRESGAQECFNISIASDNLLEGRELVLLDASSDDSIIVGIFDSIGRTIVGSIDAVGSCIGMAGNALVECIRAAGEFIIDPIINDNTTSILLAVEDGDTDGM